MDRGVGGVVPGAHRGVDVLVLDPGLVAGHLDVEVVVEREPDGFPGGERERPLADRGFLIVAAGEARGTEYPSDEIHGNPPKY